MNRVYVLGFLFALGGCSEYRVNAPPVLPPYMHKLAVRPFTNHTQQYGLEDKLTLAVQAEFNRDGRYQISTEDQADGVVIGEISRYVLDPMSYDANHVPTEYKLSIVAAVSFYDKVKAETVWTEPAMEGELRYYVASSGLAGSMTEDDARLVIYDELSRDIRTRTLEGLAGKNESGSLSTSTGTYHTQPAMINDKPPPMPSERPSAPSPTRIPY